MEVKVEKIKGNTGDFKIIFNDILVHSKLNGDGDIKLGDT